MLNPPCPWLPQIDGILDHTVTRRHGRSRGVLFYQDALRYAQSQWMAGKPAQAVLQLDKAWMAELESEAAAMTETLSPYRALAWLLCEAADGSRGYLGNPVRHFQHLATRVSGTRAEVRAWRAWCCLHLSARVLPTAGFPRDGRQLVREGIWVPGFARALGGLRRLGWAGEAEIVAQVFSGLERGISPCRA